MHRQHRLVFVIGIAILFSGILLTPSFTGAQTDISFSLDRNFGMGFGSYIQGTFTLRGNAPDGVDNLTVFFNNLQVHFVEANTITWQFNTADYEAGSVNITLVGITSSGVEYSTSRDYIFFSEIQTSFISIGIVALVAILIFVKYGSRLLNLKKKKKPTDN